MPTEVFLQILFLCQVNTITAEVSDHASGAEVVITPDENWHGMTEVTVTVTDNVFVNDSASTTFMLTVESDGIELGCTDSAASNFNANANTDNGTCAYPVADEPAKKSSGGSFGWLLLMGLPLIFSRRSSVK